MLLTLALVAHLGAACPHDSVPPLPPDTVPEWFGADSMWTDSDRVRFRHLKGIIGVVFKEGTMQRQRQAAVELVCARVVGGDRSGELYFLLVEDDTTEVRLESAVERLNRLPQVDAASPLGRSKEAASRTSPYAPPAVRSPADGPPNETLHRTSSSGLPCERLARSDCSDHRRTWRAGARR